MTDLFENTPLTIAEYDMLFKYIKEFALNEYCEKIKRYPDCEDRFKTVLQWAVKDGNLNQAYKEQFGG